MPMEWPLTVADSDVVIVREERMGELRFIVHSRRDPQFTCRTYVEAEARALSHAEQACAHAWYADGRGLQLVGSGHRPVSSPRHPHRQVDVTPTPNRLVHKREQPGPTES